jgi:drug/metabolite transporter (DMT)-like permease
MDSAESRTTKVPVNEGTFSQYGKNAVHPDLARVTQKDRRTRIMDKLRKIPGFGLLMALVSGVFFATCGFSIELMDGVCPALVVTTMSTIQLAFYLPITLCFGESLLGVKGERCAVLQRSIFGFIAFLLSFMALFYISFSDSSSILFSAPIWVSIFAYFMLKEPCGLFQVGTIIVTLLGVFMISRPTFIFGSTEEDVFTPQQRIIGIVLSFLTSISMSLAYIPIRKMKKTPTTVVITLFSAFSMIAGILTLIVWYFVFPETFIMPHTPMDWAMIALNGCCGVCAQTSLVLSLKLEEAGLVSLMRTFDIVMAFMYQASILDQPVYWQSIIGAIIICTCCVAVALKKYLATKDVCKSCY